MMSCLRLRTRGFLAAKVTQRAGKLAALILKTSVEKPNNAASFDLNARHYRRSHYET
jgi:hypothetical protein